jgi:hypothetical protein
MANTSYQYVIFISLQAEAGEKGKGENLQFDFRGLV